MLLAFGTGVLLSSCGSDEGDQLDASTYFDVGDCGAPDQRASYRSPIQISGSRPMTISTSGFSLGQEDSIRAALSVWNQQAQGMQKQKFFSTPGSDVTVRSGVGRTSIELRQLSCASIPDDNRILQIQAITSAEQWQALGLSSVVPAFTLRCYVQGVLQKQVILVEPDYVQSTQWKSVMIHEIGHSLGLEHSCDSTTEEGHSNYRSCSGLGDSHSYVQAVMFPYLKITRDPAQSELKENLRSNDRERANCLYRSQ